MLALRRHGIVRIMVAMLNLSVFETNMNGDGEQYITADVVVKMKGFELKFTRETTDYVVDPDFVPFFWQKKNNDEDPDKGLDRDLDDTNGDQNYLVNSENSVTAMDTSFSTGGSSMQVQTAATVLQSVQSQQMTATVVDHQEINRLVSQSTSSVSILHPSLGPAVRPSSPAPASRPTSPEPVLPPASPGLARRPASLGQLPPSPAGLKNQEGCLQGIVGLEPVAAVSGAAPSSGTTGVVQAGSAMSPATSPSATCLQRSASAAGVVLQPSSRKDPVITARTPPTPPPTVSPLGTPSSTTTPLVTPRRSNRHAVDANRSAATDEDSLKKAMRRQATRNLDSNEGMTAKKSFLLVLLVLCQI